MGELKPADISQTGIFTSLLYNPVTLAAFKPRHVRARSCVCAAGLNLLQTANLCSLLLGLSSQQ